MGVLIVRSMSNSQRVVMGARIGSVALLVLLIGLAQLCHASRDQSLPGSRANEVSTRTTGSNNNAASTTISTTSTAAAAGTSRSAVNTEKMATVADSEEDTEEVDGTGHAATEHVDFPKVDNTFKAGILEDAAATTTTTNSSSIAISPSLVMPAVALSVSLVVLAAKAL